MHVCLGTGGDQKQRNSIGLILLYCIMTMNLECVWSVVSVHEQPVSH